MATVIIDFLDSFPAIEPYWALLSFVLIPVVVFAICFCLSSYPDLQNRTSSYSFTLCKLAYVVDKFSILLSVGCFLLSVVLLVNQASYIYRHVNFTTSNINYYMKVNIPAFDNIQIINDAEISTSFNSLASTVSSYTYLSSSDSNFSHNSFNTIHFNTTREMRYNNRRLSTGSNQLLSLIYHKSDWNNVLTISDLISICKTERDIISSLSCINSDGYKSIVGLSINPSTCEPISSSLLVYGQAQYANFLQDGVDNNNPQSAILVSLFKLGTCQDKYNYKNFASVLQSYSVNGVQVAYVTGPYNNNEFQDDIFNAAFVSVTAVVLCAIFMILAVRGAIVTLVTFYSLAVSLITAAAFLSIWGYATFSAFNLMGVFILIGVGANSVLFFGSAWRYYIAPGKIASPEEIVKVYCSVAPAILCTIFAAVLSLFSKLVSPVIVISQLGAFLGVAVIVFYICFHYIIIPTFVFTSSFCLPESVHSWIDRHNCCRKNDTEVSGVVFIPEESSSAIMNSNHVLPDEEPLNRSPTITTRGGFSSTNEEMNRTSPIEYSQIVQSDHIHNDYGEVKSEEEKQYEPIENVYRLKTIDLEDQTGLSLRSHAQSTNSPVPLVIANPSIQHVVVSGPPPRPSGFLSCCREKWKVKLIGLITLIIALLALLVAIYFSSKTYYINSSIPQLFIPETNLGQLLIVVKDYKSNVFTTDTSRLDNLPIFQPPNPTAAPITNIPTKPTRIPISPTLATTILPSSTKPNFFNSGRPTTSPSKIITNKPSTPTVLFVPSQLPFGSKTPTTIPSKFVSTQPSRSNIPSKIPSMNPTPTKTPTTIPSKYISTQPSRSNIPIRIPTSKPSLSVVFPSVKSTLTPSNILSTEPSIQTSIPSITPTLSSSKSPSDLPTVLLSVSPSTPPSAVSTISPVSIRPSFSPTFESTKVPSSNIPTAYLTEAPSYYKTVYPSSTIVAKSIYTDYSVTGCWGLYSSKPFMDADAIVSYNPSQFNNYVSNGIVADMKNLCESVDANRNSLDLNPSWNKSIDCIYDQFKREFNSLNPLIQTVQYGLFSWAAHSTIAGGLLGIQGTSRSNLQPLWLCSNFSLRSYGISSLIANPNYAINIQNKWKKFFTDAAIKANSYGVPIIVGSSDFTYPMLALEVFNSIVLACIISVAGFFGLLWLFTLSDFALILLGTLSMIVILVVVICIHLVFYSSTVDLLDIVVLIAVISMMVDFPVHVILFYQKAREEEKKDKQNNFLSDRTAKAVSIPVSTTSYYMRYALLGPVILSILSALPLLFASLQILRKTGQYIIILSATSYVFSVVFMPFLLGFSCSTNFCKYCFGDRSNDERNDNNNNSNNNNNNNNNSDSTVVRSLYLPSEQDNVNNAPTNFTNYNNNNDVNNYNNVNDVNLNNNDTDSIDIPEDSLDNNNNYNYNNSTSLLSIDEIGISFPHTLSDHGLSRD